MVSIAASGGRIYEEYVRQGQVKHALKTGLACSVATALSYLYRPDSGQLAPVFAYLLMTAGMPHPRQSWLQTQLAVTFSAIVSAVLLVAFVSSPLVYLAVTLAWIFTCLLFTSWFPLPASLGAMISTIGIFTEFNGTVDGTLTFYIAYVVNFLIAGASVVMVSTLLGPLTAPHTFLLALSQAYAQLQERFRRSASGIRSGEATATDATLAQWDLFRPYRGTHPFARTILVCRALMLRLWFFSRAIAPVVSRTASADTRLQLASVLERCADHLNTLLAGALQRHEVPTIDDGLIEDVRWVPLAHMARVILQKMVQDLKAMTLGHNVLIASLRRPARVALGQRPKLTAATLVNKTSLRAGTKLAIMIVLLLAEEGFLRFWGGTQVAFFATFFAGTGNLGRQNKIDLYGIFGLLSGLVYGVLAAFLTSRLPEFPLLLALVFLGELLASLALQALPRYAAAGQQAGLALPFAYLATTGPGWGSLETVKTRFWGLVVAGVTAIVVHAYVWPVLPVRELRTSIAGALRDTAARLSQLSQLAGSRWEGPPPSLGELVLRGRDLLDDARYLTGADRGDPAYADILDSLQDLDATLEYVNLLLGLAPENPLRDRFFQVLGDFAEQAPRYLQLVAEQLQKSTTRAARIEPIRWRPEASERWELAMRAPDGARTASVLTVIARCFDQIAQATERLSEVASEIDRRSVNIFRERT